MTTTVTTTTVTTLAQAAALGVVAVIILLALLANKQFIANSSNERLQRLSKTLNVAIVPFMIVFAVIATVKFVTALS